VPKTVTHSYSCARPVATVPPSAARAGRGANNAWESSHLFLIAIQERSLSPEKQKEKEESEKGSKKERCPG